ncbi:MAG: hypothetical protein C4K58_01820 [Flavobacteriaceae bacterium]|nr:MAG: hypothetical protein C4K58_01820 [Flavobacteriaceae bacterium]
MKKTLLFLLVFFLLLQWFQPEINQGSLTQSDFFASVKATEEQKQMIQTSCYNCHSNQSKYPWYAKISPVSWILAHHIKEGKEHLNFSTWKELSVLDREDILKEMIEEVEGDKMPLSSYTVMHPEAKLTDAQKQSLITLFKQLKTTNE